METFLLTLLVIQLGMEREKKTKGFFVLIDDFLATVFTSAKKIWSRTITSGLDSRDRSTCGLLRHASAHLRLIRTDNNMQDGSKKTISTTTRFLMSQKTANDREK